MNSWSSASHSTSSEPIAWNRARSPLILTGRCRSASAVPLPTTPRGFCGFLNLTSPASRSGLIEMIFAPLLLGDLQRRSMRGWLVPGFWPAMTISSALWTSSRVTLALPMPIDSGQRDAASTRGTCSSSRAGCWCRTPGRTAGRRTRPRWRPARRCRSRLVGAGQRAQLGADQVEGLVPVDRLVVRAARPLDHGVGDPALLAEPVLACARRARRCCAAAKNSGVARCRVASSATALAPFSQNSAMWRWPASGSGHAQLMQSKPSAWLSFSRVCAVRLTPMGSAPASS